MSVVEEILALTRGRAATLGRGRLICVDGPAGSGKTTLAAALAGADADRVVHMDDLYPGWDGLEQVDPLVLDVLRPLARGRRGRYRRYDWLDEAPAEQHVVAPTDLLVLEGVGSGNRAWADLVTTLVWVEAPPSVRLDRGLDRDGREIRDLWLRWMDDETRLFQREQTRSRADVRVDGTVPYDVVGR